MISINSKIIKTDVTAIKILHNHIFVGIGSYLHIFCKTSFKLLNKLQIFNGGTIFGIHFTVNHENVIIYGENNIKVFTLNESITFKEISNYNSKNWILTGEWFENDSKIAIISMHNKLIIFDINLQLLNEIGCDEKCILYCAHICCYNGVILIFAGTVFNQILIWRFAGDNETCQVLERLDLHKGVIFSLDYQESSGYICSTSDDRSAILWKIENHIQLFNTSNNIFKVIKVCQVFNHLSRVFRCKILSNTFVTGGEDSLLNVWDFKGELIRKIETHQGAPVWSLDCDERENIIITGGGDCGVVQFPIICKNIETKISLPDLEISKSTGILSNGKIVTICESGSLFYYHDKDSKWLLIEEHKDLRNYSLLEISNCRKLLATGGFNGQIYIYTEDFQKKFQHQHSNTSRIFSLHWLSCKSFLICQNNGILTLFYLKENVITPINSYILPPSKERWTTTACLTSTTNFVVGDRKGHLYLYDLKQTNPIQILKKVHNHLGITKLYCNDEQIQCLGRTGIIKTFSRLNNNLQLLSGDKVPFLWLSTLYKKFLLGFSGNNFVVWDRETRRTLFEHNCGGGHRSWDFHEDNFVYIKDKTLCLVKIDYKHLSPMELVPGFHITEVNAAECIKLGEEIILISGSEDTTLRCNLMKDNTLVKISSCKSHLSSIRALSLSQLDNLQHYLIFSAGGRAQIVVWLLRFTFQNGFISDIVCSEQYSYYEQLNRVDSETRIMDLFALKINKEKRMLFCACSDGNIKIFSIILNSKNSLYEIVLYKNIFYKLKCITKLICLTILGCNILVTMATDGLLVFWDINKILEDNFNREYIKTIKVHQSGINSCSYQKLNENVVVFLTGGDDNAISLKLLHFTKCSNSLTVNEVDSFQNCGTHCAQITGTFLTANFFITSSIDQRIAIFKWNENFSKLNVEFLKQYNSSISDIQGMKCFETGNNFKIIVYGKGLEYIEIYL